MTFLPSYLWGSVSSSNSLRSDLAEDQKVGYIDMTDTFEFPESVRNEGISSETSQAETSVIEFVKYNEIPC